MQLANTSSNFSQTPITLFQYPNIIGGDVLFTHGAHNVSDNSRVFDLRHHFATATDVIITQSDENMRTVGLPLSRQVSCKVLDSGIACSD